MVSVLRTLQAEWNELVPRAQSLGVPRVRLLNAPLETIEYRRTKLEWLRSMLGSTAGLDVMTFGVEIECIPPRNLSRVALAQIIRDAGVPCEAEGLNHTLRDQWKIVPDGSLGSYGTELVSPPLRGEAGFDQVRKVCRVLTQQRCTVSKRCGLHVHIGARGEPVQFFKNLVELYASAEPFIDSFMSPSRRGSSNGYCQPVTFNPMSLMAAQTIDEVATAMYQTPGTGRSRGGQRYRKLNFMSFWQHGTVEFRHHQGTVETLKVENWIKFCLRMAIAARSERKIVSSLDELMVEVKVEESEKRYFTDRVEYFRNHADQTVARRTRRRRW